jgi:hypothetical protein
MWAQLLALLSCLLDASDYNPPDAAPPNFDERPPGLAYFESNNYEALTELLGMPIYGFGATILSGADWSNTFRDRIICGSLRL